MSQPKPNPRVQYTRRALRSALIDLICEKPLSDITVTDLCARADVNRSTFYLHYKGVHELLEEIEDAILERINAHFPPCPTLDTVDGFTGFLEHMKRTPRIARLMQVLCSDQGDPRFVHRLQQQTYEAFLRGWARHPLPEVSEARKQLIFSFLVPGIVFVLASWLQGDLAGLSAEEVSATLRALIERGVAGLPDSLPPQHRA